MDKDIKKAYDKEYYAANKAKRKEQHKKYYFDNELEISAQAHRAYLENSEAHKVAAKARRTKRRLEIIALLGGRCVKCSFDDPRALQIDHINGGGRQDEARATAYKLYKAVENDTSREIYQLLCANCNQIKRIEQAEHKSPNTGKYKERCVRGHKFTLENTRFARGARICRACTREKARERRAYD
jgi:hypothetical protein